MLKVREERTMCEHYVSLFGNNVFQNFSLIIPCLRYALIKNGPKVMRSSFYSRHTTPKLGKTCLFPAD